MFKSAVRLSLATCVALAMTVVPAQASERRVDCAASKVVLTEHAKACGDSARANFEVFSVESAARAIDVALHAVEVPPSCSAALDKPASGYSPAPRCESVRLPAIALLLGALTLLLSAFQMHRASARWRISVLR